MSATANIASIFFSCQGEGIYAGEPQGFVRFAGCNMSPKCLYCDTDTNQNNEMTVSGILSRIEKEKWPIKFISLTGGEPLLQVNFLKRLLPALKKRGFRIYLETNGTLPDALLLIIHDLDIIAMDIKLPSSGRTAVLWEKHAQFLKAGIKKEIMVKLVLTRDTKKNDFEKAVFLLKKTPAVPFILQPVTPNKKAKAIGDKTLQEFYSFASRSLKDVRIIPQLHRIFGIK